VRRETCVGRRDAVVSIGEESWEWLDLAGYRDLRAWQHAVKLADDIYSLTEHWPVREQFGLTSQTRRAAVSVPANIAEGQGRLGMREFRHHLSIAYGSLCELETLVHLARLRSYCDQGAEDRILAGCDDVGKIIRGLIKSLETE
jgi:four helix bundle protein